jgi:two-component system invasion response regulator UvrY
MTARVLVADDDARFRRAATRVVDVTPGFELVGVAASGEEAVVLVEALDPDLVLMDIRMAGIGGIAAARSIASIRPATKTILVSTYRAEDVPPDARTCGACGYLPKAELGPRTLRLLYRSAR